VPQAMTRIISIFLKEISVIIMNGVPCKKELPIDMGSVF
jgi:hypothetical protein